MKKLFITLLCVIAYIYADEANPYYGVYQAKVSMPIEKEFIANLKPQNPDNPRTGGYAKFKVTLLFNDKSALKELEVKMDIVRSIINDVVSGFMANDLQSAQGRAKFAMTATTSINAILTSSSIDGIAFPDFVIQP
ncbi:hypothetical protein CQA53_08440 [Helicobacter didelphidarum]|uniref:Flagellar protein FliL n=1 Tax=Helicobacter didelphidarum TaxID=2040648 RepID=A0A3D8IF15_9HELI|nr:flagellar basal body-associated FliL family protein [Helicobacter didelphidarum]RDU63585.1 hypothetical protein CQA53_08440 [Helicobacter didelphidarum]